MQTDCIQPFLFEHLDIRGALVSLDASWQALTAQRAYPLEVARLLGEMSAVTALIAANLKQSGRMTFQLRGEGAINLLVLDCDEQLRLRGMARWDAARLPSTAALSELLGDGQLLLSLETVASRQPYQSFVPLHGNSVAAIFEHYLSLSEQQPTRVFLAANAHRAVGMLVQKMPNADDCDADGWNRVQHLLATLQADEHLSLPSQELLNRLFSEETLRVFSPRSVRYHCPEDWQKIQAMLRSLGRAECEAVMRDAENPFPGKIHVRDDICNRDYFVDAAELDALFDAPAHRLH